MSRGGSNGTFASRGSIYLVVTVVQAMSAIVVLPLLTRRLSASDLGVVATAQLVTQLLAYLGALGLPAAITREYFEGSDGAARSQRILGLLIVVSPCVVALAHLTAPWWSGIFEAFGYGTVLKIAVWSGLARVLHLGVLAFHRAEQRVFWFGAVTIASSFGAQLAGLAALLVFDTPTGYLSGVAMCQALVAVVAVAHVRPSFRGLSDRHFLVAILGYSLPVVLHSTAGLMVTTGDRVIIERMLGLEAVGRYQAAYFVGSLGIVALLAINNAWSPMVLGTASERQPAVLAETADVLFRVAAIGGGAIALVAPLAVRIVAPPSYDLDELAHVAAFLSLATLPMAVYLGGTQVAMIGRQTTLLATSTMVGALGNVGGNILLIPPFGLKGAALATVVSYVLWAVQLRLRAGRSIVVPWNAAGLGHAVLVSLSSLVLGLMLPLGFGGTAVRLALAIVLVGSALRAVGTMTDRADQPASRQLAHR